MIKEFWRSFSAVTLFLALFSAIQLPNAGAVSTDCTVNGGSKCRATFSATGARENFVVPAGITSIDITATGGAGGVGTSPSSNLGGKGAQVIATLSVTPGETLIIVAGGQGGSAAGGAGTSMGGGGGGGGGSFIVRSTGTVPLVVAGGGGGGQGNCCSLYSLGIDASTTNDGTASTANSSSVGTAGTAGGGGSSGSSYGAGAGAGFTGNGADGLNTGAGGKSWANGSNGGTATVGCASYAQGGNGGFGGGGAACGGGGGGGGGYSGGGGSGGSSNWGGGGGGGSYYINTATSVTVTGGIQSGAGSVAITYLNAPTPTIFTTITPSFTNTTSAIQFSITFSQNVNTFINTDVANSGTASGCVFSLDASSGTSFTLTASSCSEGTLIPKILTNSVYGTVTSTYGPASDALTTTAVTLDRTAPTISSVGAAGPGTYFTGNTPTFTVNFSESVTVTGTPRLTLTVGATTKYATLYSMSDSKTALFRYTVGSDTAEFDTDGISVSTTLDLNSGTIRDLATNAISVLTFPSVTTSSVLVAQPAAAPTIDSITATSGQLAIYFTPGAARGSTTSTYQYSANGGAWTNRPTGTTTSPLTITGLTNGTGYTIRIRATTNAGAGDSSTAVTETPTSIAVTGDATLVLTYGNSASTSSYSASGGTNSFTWSLGSSLTGITLSGTTVTASSSTPAGTYTQTVRATDGNNQVGSKTLTITVNRASTSITIALPNSASNAALGGAVTITATVPRAGAVNFKLGGSTISGCGSAAAASTTATCSWTPAALGSVSLTAVFTPTDSSNYETSTTTTLSITVVNGVSRVTLSLTGGTTTPPKGQAINIIASVDQAGRITFLVDGKRIAGCYNKVAAVGNVTCSWKPAVQKQVTITANLNPTNNVYNNSTSSLKVWVVRRSGVR